MVRENLKNYMTEEEQRQVDCILERAQERMRRKQATSNGQQFLFLKCQCECYEGMMRQAQDHEHQEEFDFKEDIQKMLRQICDFCRKHRACLWEGGMEREGEVDEDLPF